MNKPVSAKNAHTPTSLEEEIWYLLMYAPEKDKNTYWKHIVGDLREKIKQKYEKGFKDGFNNAMGNTNLKDL